MDQLERFASERRFDVAWLRECGLSALRGGGIGITYYDAAGNELFTRKRDVPGSSCRFLNEKGAKMCPYGLWRLGTGTTLHITEGESDTLALWSIGLRSIGIPGAELTRRLTLDDLGGADALIVSLDNDEKPKRGERGCDVFRAGLLERLQEIGFVGQVTFVRMPDGIKDVCHLRQEDPEQFEERWADLVSRADLVRIGEPKQDAACQETQQKEKEEPRPVVVRLSDVTPEPIRFLWQQWMPEGSLVVLDGDPGLGKSSLTLDLAARLSRGDSLPPLEGPDLGRGPAGTLLMGAEDSLKHTVRPRLDAMGADSFHIHSLEGFEIGAEERPVSLPGDLERMEAFILANGIKLVVIDPLMAFISSEYDSHKDQDIRRCLRPMHRFAERLGIVVLLVRHLNKLSGGPALYRGGSSIGITGAARASLIVGRDPNEDRFILAMNKINVAKRPTSLAYRLEGCGMASRVVWDGEVDLRPDQILGHGPSLNRSSVSLLEQAKAFLRKILSGGPTSTSEVQKAAEKQGISWRTVGTARAELRVIAEKVEGVYIMRLPADGDQAEAFPED